MMSEGGEKREGSGGERMHRREIPPLREPTRSQEVSAKRKGVGSLRSE